MHLTLKKSSWCTTQQLGNVFSSLFVRVVFPPLVTLKWVPLRFFFLSISINKQLYIYKRRLTLLCQWWTSFFLISFCIGHLWNSVNKSREPSQSKQSLKGFYWKPFPSPPPQMSPPFTTSLIDKVFAVHLKDLASVSQPPTPISLLCLIANKVPLHSPQHQWLGRTREPHSFVKAKPRICTCSEESVNTSQSNARIIPRPIHFLKR